MTPVGTRNSPIFGVYGWGSGWGREARSKPHTPWKELTPLILSLHYVDCLSPTHLQLHINNGPHGPPPRPLPIRTHSLALRRTRSRLRSQSLRPLSPARTTGAQEIAPTRDRAHNHRWGCHPRRVYGDYGVHTCEIWQG